jgi:outer membrane lipoprotein LolB
MFLLLPFNPINYASCTKIKSFSAFFSILLSSVLLSGCLSTSYESRTSPLSIDERNQQLHNLQDWTLVGKIAFIQENSRESASINWQVLQSKEQQQLDLTTYLGINVLHLSTIENQHTITVDGKTYQTSDLDVLIRSLTGFSLPTKALTYWLKGLPYQGTDTISYDTETNLPYLLVSEYAGKTWQIRYDKYELTNNINLAKKFTIKENNLLIKIAINKWKI